MTANEMTGGEAVGRMIEITEEGRVGKGSQVWRMRETVEDE
jgi:hypothetical protein